MQRRVAHRHARRRQQPVARGREDLEPRAPRDVEERVCEEEEELEGERATACARRAEHDEPRRVVERLLGVARGVGRDNDSRLSLPPKSHAGAI